MWERFLVWDVYVVKRLSIKIKMYPEGNRDKLDLQVESAFVSINIKCMMHF